MMESEASGCTRSMGSSQSGNIDEFRAAGTPKLRRRARWHLQQSEESDLETQAQS